MVENKRQPNSLRSHGLVTVACDKPTRSKLKELAGDMPVSHFLRGVAFGEIVIDDGSGGAQLPIPGQELAVSRSRLASKSDINQVKRAIFELNQLVALFLALPLSIPNPLGLADKIASITDAMGAGEERIYGLASSMPAEVRSKLIEVLSSVKSAAKQERLIA